VPPVGAEPTVQAPPSVPGFVPELEPDEPELEPDEPELERPPELELEPEEPELDVEEPELEPEIPELDVDEPELEPEIPELDVDEPELEPDEPELEPPPELPDAAPDPPELEAEPLDWEPEPESAPQPVSEGEDEHAANATTAAVGNRREQTLMTGTLLAWCSGIRPPYPSAFFGRQNLTTWLDRRRRGLAQHELTSLWDHGTRGCRPSLVHTFWTK
jgi:hypothetical protein